MKATFGSDPALTSRLGAAYVAGFQGSRDGLQRDGVITVVKHWVGYGTQPEGFDAHNFYGRFATPGAALKQHIKAFGRGSTSSAEPTISLRSSRPLRTKRFPWPGSIDPFSVC
ncbi:hypothetical protein D6851_16010 [Altericroceibacterium spongiae]|uniref:Glycoside hydrolase family 3 N-terminal domain-containing protein n=1 Tax=Altericroceibacterium spongiae TaxID=2320269 RepID=A0A420EAC6_9SPHN|nr:glycoside hydrolase family 3 N-terminal domain-containing protein [Altericroceibacterium spongiae]RKF17638.1 hypothetical protein D6851_16010 [Altericroceibacterium spongiae]